MVSNKLLVSAVATLASLVVVDAGPCKPNASATSTASASLASETSTVPVVTIETSTATADSGTTTTATENGTTMTVSVSAASTKTANSETSTEASESETTGVANSETTTVTSSAEATTVVSSTEITTVATSTEGSSTVAEATTTTTVADAGPTNLLINGNFDLGTTSPWLVTANPAVRLGSNDPYEGQAYGELEYSIVNGEAYNNYVYQAIDKSRLKAGSYELSAMLRVDGATDNIYDDGCNSIGVGCYYGDPNMLNRVQGSFVTLSADDAVNQWTQLRTTCLLVEQTLSNYDYISVAIGFSCANSLADVDAVTFEEVL
ncbi:Ff.00g114300.m01.CDS01 [Fusarium sp. VM40]|nr:Ff.00g114300.m01.CDS01 [Fusarium sp. VM40]